MRLQPYIKAIGAPDWIIEIISPGSRQMDYYTKLFKYRTAGIREYWIVDPEKNRILVYNFETEQTGDYTFMMICTSTFPIFLSF